MNVSSSFESLKLSFNLGSNIEIEIQNSLPH